MTKKNEILLTTTKSILGAIPYIGTAINESIFEHRSRVKQERLNNFITSFSKYISTLKLDEVDVEYLKTEDFGDVFEAILKKVAEKRNKDKLDFFKLILVNHIFEPLENDFVDTYLDVISKINNNQIKILKGFQSIKKSYPDIRNEVKSNKSNLEILKEKRERLRKDAMLGIPGESLAKNLKDIAEAELKLLKSKDKLETVEIVRKSSFYSINKGEFIFYIQDLMAKSLLIDSGVGSIGTKAFEKMEITEFGLGLLNFIKAK